MAALGGGAVSYERGTPVLIDSGVAWQLMGAELCSFQKDIYRCSLNPKPTLNPKYTKTHTKP